MTSQSVAAGRSGRVIASVGMASSLRSKSPGSLGGSTAPSSFSSVSSSSSFSRVPPKILEPPADLGSPPDERLLAYYDELQYRSGTYGPHHPLVAETLNLLGLHHHYVTNDQDQALKYHTDALQILLLVARAENKDRKDNDAQHSDDKERRAATTNHQDQSSAMNAAVTLTDIGNVHKAKRELDLAVAAYNEALRMFRQEVGLRDDHPRVVSTGRFIDRIHHQFHSLRSAASASNQSGAFHSSSSVAATAAAASVAARATRQAVARSARAASFSSAFMPTASTSRQLRSSLGRKQASSTSIMAPPIQETREYSCQDDHQQQHQQDLYSKEAMDMQLKVQIRNLYYGNQGPSSCI